MLNLLHSSIEKEENILEATKNIQGANKTFRHRTETNKHGNSRNMAWMLQHHSLDNLRYLRLSRADYAEYLKSMPEHKAELMRRYKEVIRMWIN